MQYIQNMQYIQVKKLTSSLHIHTRSPLRCLMLTIYI
jgi:hypothetical protein